MNKKSVPGGENMMALLLAVKVAQKVKKQQVNEWGRDN